MKSLGEDLENLTDFQGVDISNTKTDKFGVCIFVESVCNWLLAKVLLFFYHHMPCVP